MKIGIITYHSVTNYGAALQCYGLQKAVNWLYPTAEVEIINYQPRSAQKYYLKRHLIKKLEYTYPVKLLNFRRFTKSYLALSGKVIRDQSKLEKLADRYDYIIVGSDEVWKVGKIRGWDPSYFLNFADPTKTKLISYAASSGTTTTYGQYTQDVKKLISNLSAISVRDHYTKRNIASLTDKKIHEVLDPTLIADFDCLNSKNRSYRKNYILVYAKLKKKCMRNLRDWADKNNLDIVSIGHKNHFDDKSYMTSGPLEWLNLIQNAEIMITNYYHGILLAVKNKTPLIPIYSEGKMAKIGDIAEKLNFNQHILKSIPSTNIPELCINYENIDALLESHKRNSIEYLRSALIND